MEKLLKFFADLGSDDDEHDEIGENKLDEGPEPNNEDKSGGHEPKEDERNREDEPSQDNLEEDDEAEDSPDEKTTDEKARLAKLVNSFTPEQLDRYEKFRRSALPKHKISKLAREIGCPISAPVAIMFGALGKMFVGDMVETARILMSQQNCQGPIRPEHLHQAHRKLELQGRLLNRNKRRRSRY